MSQGQIAEAVNKSKNTVCYWLRKYGLVTKYVLEENQIFRHRCLFCEQPFVDSKRSQRTFCSHDCHQQYEWRLCRQEIELTGEVKSTGKAKRYLKEVRGCKCEICGLSQWLGQVLPLILDHIDGNSENWKLVNLRLICSNCDSLTPTYKGRNVGKGRHSRRQRYLEGKSY